MFNFYFPFYILEQSHSSVERAGLLGGVIMRAVEPDETNRLNGEVLEAAIKQDLEAGLFPFFVSFFSNICLSFKRLKL